MDGEELRVAFRHQMVAIDEKVMRLFAMVAETLSGSTDSFLAGDTAEAREVIDRASVVDDLYLDVERIVERTITLQAPVAGDLRYLLAALRIVPELERSGDLAEHIANRAATGLGNQLTPTVRGKVERMGSIALKMWAAAADAYADRDASAAKGLDLLDDELDELRVEMFELLESGELPLRPAIDMAMITRFYERLGDHALHITERVRYLVEGP
jgi:phosphate transport system protein